MMRKLTAFAASLLLGFTFLAQASPAQAWPDFTVDSTSIPLGSAYYSVVSVGKTVASDAVFVFSEEPETGPRYLKSYIVSPTGQISGPYTITSNSGSANYVVRQKSVWVDPAGKFNVVFFSWGNTDAGLQSKLFHTYSSDGTTWSTPELLEDFVGSSATCQQIWCGIRDTNIGLNAAGTVALNYSITDGDGTLKNKLYLRTKPLGKAWSTKSAIFSDADSVMSSIIVPLGSGWLAAWGTWGETSRMYSSYSTGDKISTWTAPQSRNPASCSFPTGILQISPKKFGLVYADNTCQEQSNAIIKYQSFDVATKRFSDGVALDTLPNNAVSTSYSTAYLAGQSALGYSVLNWDSGGRGYAKYILFRNGVPSVHFVNQGGSYLGGTQEVIGLTMDPLGHLTAVWSSSSGDGGYWLTASQIYRGNRSDADLPLANIGNGLGMAMFSPDGDIYVSSIANSRINAVERIRSDSPEITGSISVSGTPKANATIKSKLPLVVPTQLFQTWKNSYQWFSCTYEVPEVLNVTPVGCTEIAGATTATYKAKAADKGKYLVARLTVKSDNVAQVQFSVSTKVVK